MLQEEFVLLRDFIYEKSGIFYTEGKKYLLENRLKNRLVETGAGSFENYYYYIRYSDPRGRELYRLFDVVTTNETYFFRNQKQLESFKHLVRRLVEQPAALSPLRIWSAGCATGEEAYTLAIMLDQLSEEMSREIPYIISATDISVNSLEAAKRGIFGDYAMRHVPEGLRDRYFTFQNGGYFIKDEMKKYVRIDFMNLNDLASYRKYSEMDVIFCRNVLIYFDEAAKKKVIDSLFDCLRPGGYLAVGHSEMLYPFSRSFKPIPAEGAGLYVKRLE
ncbi:MAG TPA: chemotaxis protein [Deltaproteobacteria bacterium]|nr:chemotaxis protein [Deltaproteobacteria bacterium]